jgi:cytochrome P450
MFLAGHETAASSLSWTLYLLAQHSAVGESLACQLEEGSADQLLEQVIREGLRLYPPAYRISRTTVRSCDIGGQRIDPGAEIIIPQWAVQRSPRHFQDPDAFRPERWTQQFLEQLPRFAYFPFGGGPRTCIGSAFSQVEASIVIGEVARRFQLRVPPDADPRPYLGVTLLPEGNSLRLQVLHREARAAPRHRPTPSVGRCPFPHARSA